MTTTIKSHPDIGQFRVAVYALVALPHLRIHRGGVLVLLKIKILP